MISPLSEEQDRILNPRKVYNKDPKEYNLNQANLSDIKPDQIYLVKNLTALHEVVIAKQILNFDSVLIMRCCEKHH